MSRRVRLVVKSKPANRTTPESNIEQDHELRHSSRKLGVSRKQPFYQAALDPMPRAGRREAAMQARGVGLEQPLTG
jgi:hypothetical protein